MEVEISPITPEITKQLARLYPSAETNFPEANNTKSAVTPRKRLRGSAKVLDGFFAADFIPPRDQSNGNNRVRQGDVQRVSAGNVVESADRESYGIKYVRYLQQFIRDLPVTGNRRTTSSGAGWVAEECASGILRALDSKGVTEWKQAEREKMLARAIVVQARIEQCPELLPTLGARLAGAFGRSQLAPALWQSIQWHLHPNSSSRSRSSSRGSTSSGSSSNRTKAVALDELEVAIELLYLFSNWTEAHVEVHGVQQVVLAVELFTRYSRQVTGRQQGEMGGRVQRIRLGHKALLLLEITWVAVVGDESEALRRIGADEDCSSTAKGLQRRGLARDALRQVRAAVDKYPQLATEVQGHVARLESVVHPFDGHMTRATQAGRFGPIRRRSGGVAARQAASPRVQLADMLARRESMAGESTRPWMSLRRAPRAAREAVEQSIQQVQATKSEREYAEWWRRLVAAHGMPLRLTMGGDRRGAGGDVAIDHTDSSAQSQPYELCGIVEAEDLPGLECHLDGRDVEIPWPESTCSSSSGDADAILYRALFPLLPQLSQALVRTVVNWAPVERELPARQFLAAVGPPQPSEATCLGIVKYPRLSDALSLEDVGNLDNGRASTRSPLGGSNVRRLGAAHNQGTNDSTSSLLPPPSASSPGVADPCETVPAGVAARLLTQYAQWQSLGGLLMRMLVGLQAGHVLHADYFAQLLMNENVIPAMFWWLGTAALDLCATVPHAIRLHSFSAEFARAAETSAQAAAEVFARDSTADPAMVGVDTSDSDDAADRMQPSAVSVGPATAPLPTAANETESITEPCTSALCGIYDCMRSLRRLTSSNGLRKGLLYKNKGLYFLGKLLRMPSKLVQQVAAEMCRDIMPVVSRRQRQNMLDIIGQVYLHAPVAVNDAFWLAEPIIDPHIEMHRHVELLRLLHFYHLCALGLQLPKDSALFPSLIALTSPSPVCDLLPLSPLSDSSRIQKYRGKRISSTRTKSALNNLPNSKHYSNANVSSTSSCGMQSTVPNHNNWLSWESDLEDTLNDVYSPSFGTSQS
ncbi:hypothetical protein COEREDRAFT_88359 [Coemansia reversa NRRL 1564]|uniref:Far11/STRP C-terminal domain-containing protein n=1 Tax=Coemansia reversa (strain ATCC 12441 / NRRL 1564) TaxID=763665 RepID=A0A2G5B747_COERN|nr:hypothetical protein COEREDRAFT_88359 [Coemansia reversa NRRL 1564]|eukprot:PIA14835.1 hypothetical protein COEREDRAFT_88359 [Coemansia reversa NRRL 1564]